MNRLLEIKRRLDEIEQALDKQYPRFRADKHISDMVTELKEYAQLERKKIQTQLKQDELSDFEERFIEPAINDVYLSAIDKIRKGAKPSVKLNDYIGETSSTLSYWLCAIEESTGKKVL